MWLLRGSIMKQAAVRGYLSQRCAARSTHCVSQLSPLHTLLCVCCVLCAAPLAVFGRASPRLAAVGRGWPRLAAVGRGWPRFVRSPDSDRRIVTASPPPYRRIAASPHRRASLRIALCVFCWGPVVLLRSASPRSVCRRFEVAIYAWTGAWASIALASRMG
jgi:hypothetical protein